MVNDRPHLRWEAKLALWAAWVGVSILFAVTSWVWILGVYAATNLVVAQYYYLDPGVLPTRLKTGLAVLGRLIMFAGLVSGIAIIVVALTQGLRLPDPSFVPLISRPVINPWVTAALVSAAAGYGVVAGVIRFRAGYWKVAAWALIIASALGGCVWLIRGSLG